MRLKLNRPSTLCMVLLCGLLASCGKEEAPKADTQAVEAKAPTAPVDPNVVVLTQQIRNFIKLAEVEKVEMQSTLRIPGRIQVNEQYEAKLGSPVTGRITDIYVTLGQKVSVGQALAAVKSPDLAQYQLAYIKAAQQIQLQSKAVERAKLLLEADVISVAEVQRREAELSAAQAERNAAHDQLMALGMTKQGIAKLGLSNSGLSTSVVASKINGTVVSRNARIGQVVGPDEDLFVVADLNHVWAVAEIPEQQIANIKKGQTVTIVVPSLGDAEISGELSFVGDTVNPETRTVIARTELKNHDKTLKPEMLISILLEGRPTMEAAIPITAVVHESNQDYVFVQTQHDQVKLKQVNLGNEHNGFVVVTGGLNVGEVVVTDGAFHLNNERKRKEME